MRAMQEQPNILLIVIDCLRSDRLFSPERTCKTPNIDRLIARGTSVPNVFVENSMTAPSFASLFTGNYAGNHGVVGMVGVKLNENIPTMAENIKDRATISGVIRAFIIPQ